jgi:hypothetical protein
MRSWLSRLLFPAYYRTRKGGPVRYAFPIVALTALFAGLASVVTQDGSYIAISTSPSSVREGEQFMVDVRAYAHTPINAVDITLNYPQNQMTIESIDTGTSVITLWTQDPYAKDGKIHLTGGVFQKGFLGEHTIARVRARATASGLAYVSLDTAALIAGDGKGTEVTVERTEKDTTKIYVTSADGALIGEASVAIVTDINGDGSVGIQDISAFMAAWFTRGKVFDFDNDGRMTFKDFSILLSDSFFR